MVERHPEVAAVGLACSSSSTAGLFHGRQLLPVCCHPFPCLWERQGRHSDGLSLALDVQATSFCKISKQEFKAANCDSCILTINGEELFMEGLHSSAHGHARQGQGPA